MSLNFGTHEDVVFDGAPLTSVLCQIQFPPILALISDAGLTGFQTILREQYPILLPKEQAASVQVGPDSIGVSTSPPVWRLTDEAKQWTVGLAVNFVSLETPSYSSIDEFLARMDHILHALRSTLRPADSLRIGLRKINAIGSGDPNFFRTSIRPEVLGILAVEDLPVPISQAGFQVQFDDDENALVVRSGLADDGAERRYVLDMDYFTERPYPVGPGEDIVSLLRYFSEGMTSFFHWATTQDYRSSLRPRPRTQK